MEETVTLQARARDGTLARIDLTWSFGRDLPHFLQVIGSKGTIQVGWGQSRIQNEQSGGEWEEFGSGYDKSDAFRTQWENFLAARDRRAAPIADWKDSLAATAGIDAAYRSLKSGHWEAIPGLSPVAPPGTKPAPAHPRRITPHPIVSRPLASLSIDLDDQWSYMKTHGDFGWESFPSYFDVAIPPGPGAAGGK